MVQIVKFKNAQIGLYEFRTFEPQKAFDTLNRIIALSDLAKAMKHLKKPIKKLSVDISIHHKSDVEEIDRKILDMLNQLFPIDSDYMMDYTEYTGQSIFENVNHLPIVTEFVGWYTSWDEINEAMQGDDHGGFAPHMAVPIFVGAYMNNFDEKSWNFFNAYFGWGVPYPEMSDGNMCILGDVYRKIQRSKKIKFDKSFIEAICMDTGLAFFDWNPYSEDPDESPFAWNYNTIIHLANQWVQAKKIVDRLEYNYEVGKDPEQLKLLLQIFQECETGQTGDDDDDE